MRSNILSAEQCARLVSHLRTIVSFLKFAFLFIIAAAMSISFGDFGSQIISSLKY